MSMNFVANLRGEQGPQGDPGPELSDSGWIDLDLAEGWELATSGGGIARIRKRGPFAIVEMRIQRTSSTAGQTVAVTGTLPTGFHASGYYVIGSAIVSGAEANLNFSQSPAHLSASRIGGWEQGQRMTLSAIYYPA